MKLYTIGFTRKSAEQFFTTLRNARVVTLIDVRLNNVSQLAGFAKRDDLRFFVSQLCGANYVHKPELAPTQEMLDAYRKGGMSWAWYEDQFRALIRERHIEQTLEPAELDGACLLCSEDKPHHCHRRIVAEYLREHWPDLQVTHLE